MYDIEYSKTDLEMELLQILNMIVKMYKLLLKFTLYYSLKENNDVPLIHYQKNYLHLIKILEM